MKKRFSKTFTITIATILLLFFLQFLGFLQPALGLFQKILSPAQETIYNISQLFQFKSTETLRQENIKLEKKFQQSLIDQVELVRLKQENNFLKQELNFLETQDSNYQIAKIIAKETLLGRKILILNKGKKDGVEQGCPVIVSGANKRQGYLVAKITETENSISHALVITDSRSSIAAKINDNKNTTGLVTGERGLTLKMDLIPLNQEVKIGDLIITSGLENKIPDSLIIGEINELLSKPGDFFQKVKVNPFIDFETLRIVTILLP